MFVKADVSKIEEANHAKLRSTIEFPNPVVTLAEGIVAVGGKLDVGTLYHAYRLGIFPWPQPKVPMLWFCPDQRGVLFFEKYRRPKSFQRFLKKKKSLYQLSWNQNFQGVIEGCQKQIRRDQPGTWILPSMKKAYLDFHRAGFAQSIECSREGKLVAGLYGVFVEGVFSGESMFHTEDNTSKLCLDYAVETLAAEGIKWMDIQMVTPLLKAFGGELIPRQQYLRLLHKVQSLKIV
ncbi:MAG: leucyl/phenylalanyl-tRNA--protein transferase [Bdellovibrionaceae bacterium]|nr:leucyl/phenylalanyl-tRNA--protein transferase [Pseudobdellovibrionaceae bacterium]